MLLHTLDKQELKAFGWACRMSNASADDISPSIRIVYVMRERLDRQSQQSKLRKVMG
jgi:hypothetical protein